VALPKTFMSAASTEMVILHTSIRRSGVQASSQKIQPQNGGARGPSERKRPALRADDQEPSA
jgi:hypothetical protein